MSLAPAGNVMFLQINKHMKKAILSICLLLSIVFAVYLISCTKSQVEFQQPGSPGKLASLLFSTDSPTIYNYVSLSNDQIVRPQDSGFRMSVTAAFTDSITGQISTMSSVMINNRSLSANTSHSYSFAYSDSGNNAIQEGKNLYGTNVNIKVTGTSASDTITQMIYMPKRVFKTLADFPYGPIDISKSLTLNWTPDPACTWGKIGIQIMYNATVSRFMHDATLPPNDTTVIYIVPDNGSYTISSTELQRFKPNSIINISIGRGSILAAVLPISKKRIFYYATSSLSSLSLTLISTATITASKLVSASGYSAIK